MKPIPIIVGVLCALCTLFAAGLLEQRLGPIMTGDQIAGTNSVGTNQIDLSNVTNLAALFETRQPNKVTIWFNVRVRSYTISDSITTNAWPVTASNALMMVKARFPEDTNSIIEHITLTGIWRDE